MKYCESNVNVWENNLWRNCICDPSVSIVLSVSDHAASALRLAVCLWSGAAWISRSHPSLIHGWTWPSSRRAGSVRAAVCVKLRHCLVAKQCQYQVWKKEEGDVNHPRYETASLNSNQFPLALTQPLFHSDCGLIQSRDNLYTSKLPPLQGIDSTTLKVLELFPNLSF